jgi:hypothetical protein
MKMEVLLGCGTATILIVDELSAPIVGFEDVPVIGSAKFCDQNGFGAEFQADPGKDFRSGN